MATKCRVLVGGKCAITQKYKEGTHNGIDITSVNAAGTHVTSDIVAHSSGLVTAVYKSCNKTYTNGSSYGNYVMIDHGNGYSTLYAHLAYGTVKVKKGQEVKRGEALGYMGNTGHSNGAHLHFEVRKDGKKIDPTKFLNAELKPSDVINVTKILDVQTVKGLQKVLKCDKIDGYLSGQSVSNKKWIQSYDKAAVKFGLGGSSCIKALQKMLGCSKIDGHLGKNTIADLQKFLKVEVDSYLGPKTVAALQEWINRSL